jgi:hypothetical protein
MKHFYLNKTQIDLYLDIIENKKSCRYNTNITINYFDGLDVERFIYSFKKQKEYLVELWQKTCIKNKGVGFDFKNLFYYVLESEKDQILKYCKDIPKLFFITPGFMYVDLIKHEKEALKFFGIEQKNEDKKKLVKSIIQKLNKPIKVNYPIKKLPYNFILFKYNDNSYIFSVICSKLFFDVTTVGVVFDLIEVFYNNNYLDKFLLYFRYFIGGIHKESEINARVNFAFRDIQKNYKKKDLVYWKKRLNKCNPYIDFGLHDKNDKGIEKRIHFKLVNDKFDFLKKKFGVTDFVIMSAVFSSFINRIFVKDDILLKYPISSRNEKHKYLTGFHEKMMLLRIQFKKENINLFELLKQISDNIHKDKKHTKISYKDIFLCMMVKNKNLNNKINVSLAETLFFNKTNLNGVDVSIFNTENRGEIMNELTLLYEKTNNCINMAFEYDTSIIDDNAIWKMKYHFIDYFDFLLNNPYKSILSNEFMKKNHPYTDICGSLDNDYGLDIPIIRQFRYRSKKYPNMIAVEINSDYLTYKDLYEKIDKFSNYLKHVHKVNRGSYVGMFMTKSFDLIIAMFAIFKLGCIYFPIDPKTLNKKIRYMLEQTKCKTIITNVDGDLVQFETENIIRFNYKNACDFDSTLIDCEDIDQNTICYATFISDKDANCDKLNGILMNNGNLINLCYNFERFYYGHHVKNIKVVGFYSDISDAAHICEVLPTLLNGHVLTIIPDNVKSSPTKMLDYINKKEINAISLPSDKLKLLPRNEKTTLEIIIVNGENYDKEYWSSKVKKVVELYGSPECTFISMYHIIDKMRYVEKYDNYNSDIKKFSRNCYCYILNERMNHVPIGFKGELYVAGSNVIKNGYINNEKLTKERFLPDPFQKNGIVYKSGIFCKYDKNFDIVFSK